MSAACCQFRALPSYDLSMGCNLLSHGQRLIISYFPEVNTLRWIDEKFQKGESIRLADVFFLTRRDRLSTETVAKLLPLDVSDECAYFSLGMRDGEYYRIQGRKLGISQNVFLSRDLRFVPKCFRATRGVSVFKQIARLMKGDIHVGGSNEEALPEREFRNIVKAIPSNRELELYVSARISSILRNYIDGVSDARRAYERLRNRKPSRVHSDLELSFASAESEKYIALVRRIEDMLSTEEQYSEKAWQREVLDVVLLAFPQYLRAFPEAPIQDKQTQRTRFVDFLLVDSAGHVDLLEIKSPGSMRVVTRSTYRDNHIPYRELSGTIMQLEKYLYHLTRNAVANEEKLNSKYAAELPPQTPIQVTNPRAMVLLGRDSDLNPVQRLDLEVIRRQYRNIVDIMTYDDLVRRLHRTIARFSTPEHAKRLPSN